jgi:hypothetical protein
MTRFAFVDEDDLHLCAAIIDGQADLDARKAEIERRTGQTFEEFLSGMARLLEPIDGYVPGSMGAMFTRSTNGSAGGRV